MRKIKSIFPPSKGAWGMSSTALRLRLRIAQLKNLFRRIAGIMLRVEAVFSMLRHKRFILYTFKNHEGRIVYINQYQTCLLTSASAAAEMDVMQSYAMLWNDQAQGMDKALLKSRELING